MKLGNKFTITTADGYSHTLDLARMMKEAFGQLLELIDASIDQAKSGDDRVRLDSPRVRSLCALWSEYCTGVSGYELEEGADWKALVPLMHRYQAMNIALAQVMGVTAKANPPRS